MGLGWTGLSGPAAPIAGTGTVFTEYTTTISGTDNNIAAIYVDWGDGETPSGVQTNDKRYSNYQWIQLTDPKESVTVKHTYTATGTYYPVVQMINSEGFASSYYSAQATGSLADNYPLPYQKDSGVSGAKMIDGQATGIMKADKRIVKSGIDNSIFEYEGPQRIYGFIAPTLTNAELAYLNEPAGNTAPIEVHIDCDLALGMYDETGGWAGSGDYKRNHVIKYDFKTSRLDISDNEEGFDDILAAMASGDPVLSGSSVIRINSVKMIKCKTTIEVDNQPQPPRSNQMEYATAMDKFRLFICAASDTWINLGARGLLSDRNGYQQAFTPLCYLSAGDPVKRAEDPERFVTFDFSQSRAKASNVSLSNYRWDDGTAYYKLWNSWELNDGSKFLGTGNYFTDETMTTDNTHRVSYTYRVDPMGISNGGDAQSIISGGAMNLTGSNSAMPANTLTAATPWSTDASRASRFQVDQYLLNDYFSFADQYYLARMSAQPSSAANLSGANVSSISGNRVKTFRISGIVSYPTGSETGFRTYPTKVNNAHSSNYSNDFTKAAYSNTPGDSLTKDWTVSSGLGTWPIANSSVSLYRLNDSNLPAAKDGNMSGALPSEYLLMLLTGQTNSIFIDIANYAPGLGMGTSQTGTTSEYNSTGGPQPPWTYSLQYLSGRRMGTIHQTLEWKTLEIEDNTKLDREFTMTATNYDNYNLSGNRYFVNSAPLSKSGPVTFDVPTDWVNISLSGASAGTFNRLENSLELTNADVTEVQISGAFVNSGEVSGYGYCFKFSGSNINTLLNAAGFNQKSDIGSYKYAFFPKKDSTTTDTMDKMYWLGSGAADGWDGDDSIFCQYGDSSELAPLSVTTANAITGSIRRINIYDALPNYSKVYNDGTRTTPKLVPVDGNETVFPNIFNVTQVATSSGVGQTLEDTWGTTEHYPLRMVLEGPRVSNSYGFWPGIKNIFDTNQANNVLIKEVDNSAYGLVTHPITSDVSVTRAGTYYQAVSRKGRVHIQRTGTPIQKISFTSVDLGDYSSFTGTSWAAQAEDNTQHSYFRMIRRLQGDSRRVYWDERQKDSTYVRFWGVIDNLQETFGADGPRAVNNYTFNMIVEEIALIDPAGRLMTDPFPLGATGEFNKSWTGSF